MNNMSLCEIVSRKLDGVNDVLDIGCGDGFLVCCLANKLKRKSIGLDIAAKGFAKAHNYCRKFDVCGAIECVRGDAHDMRMFENNEFDAVTLIFALHHMNDPETVLKEAKRVLKSQGRIAVVEYIVRKRRGKCHKFVKEEVNRMMENAGFKETTVHQLERDIILVTSQK